MRGTAAGRAARVAVARHAEHFRALVFDRLAERANAEPARVLRTIILVDDDDGKAKFHPCTPLNRSEPAIPASNRRSSVAALTNRLAGAPKFRPLRATARFCPGAHCALPSPGRARISGVTRWRQRWPPPTRATRCRAACAGARPTAGSSRPPSRPRARASSRDCPCRRRTSPASAPSSSRRRTGRGRRRAESSRRAGGGPASAR